MVFLEGSPIQLQGTLTLLLTRVWLSSGKRRHYMTTFFLAQRWLEDRYDGKWKSLVIGASIKFFSEVDSLYFLVNNKLTLCYDVTLV
ncbi:hypothetical protein Leryth_011212 [Lithospermum erythrorhizon]|nr:hypothetical protein Leryth_011212 [Lithospermum erythrorhizon]